jgi:hypothetical protein
VNFDARSLINQNQLIWLADQWPFSAAAFSSVVQVTSRALLSHSLRSLRTWYNSVRPRSDKADDGLALIRFRNTPFDQIHLLQLAQYLRHALRGDLFHRSQFIGQQFFVLIQKRDNVDRSVSDNLSAVDDCLRSFLISRVITVRSSAASRISFCSVIYSLSKLVSLPYKYRDSNICLKSQREN